MAPVIVAVERAYRDAAQTTIDEIQRKLPELSAEDHASVTKSIQRLVGRLLHLPVRAIRGSDEHAREALRRVFTPPEDGCEGSPNVTTSPSPRTTVSSAT